MSEHDSEQEPQPGADEEGFGGDAPEPAEAPEAPEEAPEPTPGETTTAADDDEDYEPSEEPELGGSRLLGGPTTQELNPAFTEQVD